MLLYDGLTKAFSREAFGSRIETEFARSSRSGRPFSLLLLDLDYFKSINDAFGHQRGDRALQEFIHRVQSFIRASDSVFRLGGDEFVILLPETNLEQAKILAERLLQCVADEPMPGAPPISLTVSIGIASYPEDAGSYEQLFEVADRRHYASKALGRGRVTVEDVEIARLPKRTMPDRLIEREQAEARLRDFFARLVEHPHGLLYVTGAPDVGHGRFLNEAATVAKLRGFAVLHLHGGSALRSRSYGALFEALHGWLHPPEFLDPENLVAFMVDSIRNKELAGLVVLAERPQFFDSFTHDALRALLRPEDIRPVGFICTDDGRGGMDLSDFQFAHQMEVELLPISSKGVKIWLRHCLEWEPTARLVQWVYQNTDGLPDRIQKLMDWLLAHKRLRKTERGWQFTAPASSSFRPDSVFHPPSPPENLPHPLPDLVGREREIEALKKTIRSQRLVTLVGGGGLGKTHLALQAMRELQEEFPDGTFWLACESSVSPEQLLASIASAIGLRLPAAQDPLSGLTEALADKRLLFLLDNFGTALDASNVVEALAKQTRNLTLLVTSQIELGVAGEEVVPLHGLPVPSNDPDGMRACPSVQLFLHRARHASPDFVGDLDGAARICHLTDGMPLGIEVAAAWAATLTCDEIAGRIQESAGTRSAFAGEGALLAVFDSLWKLLSESEQRVLTALCIFRGGFRRSAAREIADASSFFLEALSARAFSQRMGKGRYRLHHSLRHYLLEKLAAEPVLESYVSARHSAYYLLYLQENQSALSKAIHQDVPAADAVQEVENIRLAWEWAIRNHRAAGLASALDAYMVFLRNQAWFREGVDLLLRLRTEFENDESAEPLTVKILEYLGEFHYHMGAYLEGLNALEPALEKVEKYKELHRQIETYRLLANLYSSLGRFGDAEALFRRALARAEELGDLLFQYQVCNNMGVLYYFRNDLAHTREWLERALSRARQLGDPAKLAQVSNNLANLCYETGDLDSAKTLISESMSRMPEVESKSLHGSILDTFGKVAVARGEFGEARGAYREALELARTMSAPPLSMILLIGVAELWEKLGELSAAFSLGVKLALLTEVAPPDVRPRVEQLCARMRAANVAPDDLFAWKNSSLEAILAHVQESLAFLAEPESSLQPR